LSIKGGPGHGREGLGEKSISRAHAKDKESIGEANLGFRERRVETYKIYIF
jgi:hypothetical protein